MEFGLNSIMRDLQGAGPDDQQVKNPPAAPATPSDADRLDSMVQQMDALLDDEFLPLEPESLEQAGVRCEEVEALVLKYLLNCGAGSGRRIAEQIHMPARLIGECLKSMKSDLLITPKSSTALGDFVYQLTESGSERARRDAEKCTYYGAAPVPLEDYVRSVRAQSLSRLRPRAQQLREAFGDLTLHEEIVSQLGQAINAGRGLFLYGAPGNGKTSFAERITRAFGQHLWIPRTISVTGEMIRLFDPSTHEELPRPESALSGHAKIDERWVLIRRPTVIVGGELTLEQLDIRFNPGTGIYEAPVHLKSNGGTLVVDDFGRQRVSSVDLLNRWIVPLEKRVDFLNLASGRQIEVPFEQLLVLSTNLEPRDLVDEAFLRRIPYKIEVNDPTEHEFRQLFRKLSPEMGLKYSDDAVTHLIHNYYRETGRSFRFCQARDLLLQVLNRCEFHELPKELTTEGFDVAVKNYFAVM